MNLFKLWRKFKDFLWTEMNFVTLYTYLLPIFFSCVFSYVSPITLPIFLAHCLLCVYHTTQKYFPSIQFLLPSTTWWSVLHPIFLSNTRTPSMIFLSVCNNIFSLMWCTSYSARYGNINLCVHSPLVMFFFFFSFFSTTNNNYFYKMAINYSRKEWVVWRGWVVDGYS